MPIRLDAPMEPVPPSTDTPNDHQDRVRRLRAQQADARMQPDISQLLPPSRYRRPPFSLRKFLICLLVALSMAWLVSFTLNRQIAHVTVHQQLLLDEERAATGESAPPTPARPVPVLIIDDWATQP